MKFGPINISLRRKAPQPAGAKAGQPETFLLAVRKYADEQGHKVAYSHSPRSGDASIPVKKIPCDDALQVAEDIEEFIEARWGGGDWKLQILNADNLVIGTYQKQVAGPLYNVRTGKKKTPGDPDGSDGDGSGGNRRNGAFDAMMMEVMKQNLNPMGQMAELATVMQTLSGGNSGSGLEALASEIISATVNNSINKDEGRLNEIKSIIEIGQMFTPKVAPEDPLSNVIAALPGIIGGLGAMKGLGSGAASPQIAALPPHNGNGGVDMNALKKLALSMPETMIGGLPPDEQAVIMQLRQGAPTAGQQSAILPRPGEQLSAQPGGGAGISPVNPVPLSSPYHAAIDTMIADIRQDLGSGTPDSQVAKKMISMVTYARGFATEPPHPMLARIMSATDETGHEEFARLCSQMGLDQARIRSLGAEILTLMHAGATETLESLDDSPEEQGNISDDAGPEFIYETEADREAALKGESANDGNALRSTGIPGKHETAEGQPGRVKDQADSEPIREGAQDSVQADEVQVEHDRRPD